MEIMFSTRLKVEAADRDWIQHGYDRNSSRIWRENLLGPDRDELYDYDGLHRLVDMRHVWSPLPV